MEVKAHKIDMASKKARSSLDRALTIGLRNCLKYNQCRICS